MAFTSREAIFQITAVKAIPFSRLSHSTHQRWYSAEFPVIHCCWCCFLLSFSVVLFNFVIISLHYYLPFLPFPLSLSLFQEHCLLKAVLQADTQTALLATDVWCFTARWEGQIILLLLPHISCYSRFLVEIFDADCYWCLLLPAGRTIICQKRKPFGT